jgi:two-component system, NarL family, sensor histidine kinase EvgS
MTTLLTASEVHPVELARVLLVDDDPASRLTLQTILQASGYHVESAASAAEAFAKLDQRKYELVLSDLGMESPEAGYKVIAHARRMEYRPATAILTTYHNHQPDEFSPAGATLLIEPEDVPGLLTKIANLISGRASRRVNRELLRAGY